MGAGALPPSEITANATVDPPQVAPAQDHGDTVAGSQPLRAGAVNATDAPRALPTQDPAGDTVTSSRPTEAHVANSTGVLPASTTQDPNIVNATDPGNTTMTSQPPPVDAMNATDISDQPVDAADNPQGSAASEIPQGMTPFNKKKLWLSMKASVQAVRDCSDAFPPLKSALSAVAVIFDYIDVCCLNGLVFMNVLTSEKMLKGNESKIMNLDAKLRRIEEIFKATHISESQLHQLDPFVRYAIVFPTFK